MPESKPTPELGLIGLAVMGQNLALNIARQGFPIVVHNRTAARTREFLAAKVGADDPITPAWSIAELVSLLRRPRKVLLMVKAGDPVDATLDQLSPLLEPGDIVVDGGNSHPRDTERRGRALATKGIRFVGMGVSGGEKGALEGPSLMPGGPRDAWPELRPILERIAAQVEDGPCVTWIGPGSSGHFVKMVHNGIEYGDMQLIAETYDLLHVALGMADAEMGEVFERWNQGVLESYLVEITARILQTVDPATQRPILEVIVDRAGQKGTGRWASEAALELGVPAPTILAAVAARALSARREERIAAAGVLRGPDLAPRDDSESIVADAHDALYAAKVCSYAQGMDLLRVAGEENCWDLDLGEIARIWKGGCIIRARLLRVVQDAYRREPRPANLLLAREVAETIDASQHRWRRAVALAAEAGVPVLASASSLSYYDSYRRERLPQNLTQAQRDYFGAHTFERVDRPGERVHFDWD